MKGPGPVTIYVLLSTAGNVDVRILTTGYRVVNDIQFPQVPAGLARLAIPLQSKSGAPLANGLYYLVVQTPNQRQILKLLILR